jgi:simple sugar transport system substrate-binding protein
MRIVRTLLALGLAACLAACDKQPQPPAPSGPSASKPLVVGFSQIGAESAWRAAETASIRDEAAKRGMELRFSDAQGKQAAQIQAIESFVDQRVDAIILAPVVESGWDAVLAKARKANIPVILVDRGITVADDSLYTTLIESDHVEAGREVARWLVARSGGTAGVVQLEGTPGAGPAIDRRKGFEEVIKDHPGIKIVRSQTGDFKKTTGKQVMEAIIRSDKDTISAVYAHNDDMALGAIQALQEAGLEPGKKVLVMSIDGGRDAFLAMKDGTLNCVMECNPLLGPPVFDAIRSLREGMPVPRFIRQTDRLFDASQAQAELPNRKY